MRILVIMLCALTGLAGAQQSSIPKPPPGVPPDAKFFNGHWYKVVFDRVDWPQAKQECERKGGQLAVIPDAATWAFVNNLTQRRVWLGASDEAKEGTWKWIDGTAMSFTAWDDGEPNNVNKKEHYLCRSPFGGWADTMGKWDGYSQWLVDGYICQWRDPNQIALAYSVPILPAGIPADAKIFNGQGYKVFFEHVNWDEAKQRCEQRGGQLAVIPDAAAWAFAKNLTQMRVWLGASDEAKEGTWTWVDGTAMTFAAWDDGQPDNANRKEHYLRRSRTGGWADHQKQWDADSSPVEGYICQWKGTAAKMAPAAANPAIIEVATWDAASGVLTMKSQNRLRSFRVTPATTISLNGLKSKPDFIAPALRVMSFTLVAGNAEELGSLTLEGIAKPAVPAPAVPQADKPQDPVSTTGSEIISATYGSGSRQADVTERVINFMITNPRRLVVTPRDLGADPSPGWNKELVVTQKWNGRRRMLHWGENSWVEPVTFSVPNSKEELTEWLPGTKWQGAEVMIFHPDLFLAEGTVPAPGQSYPRWKALDGRKVMLSLESGSEIEFGLSWDCATMVEKGPTKKTLKRITSPTPLK